MSFMVWKYLRRMMTDGYSSCPEYGESAASDRGRALWAPTLPGHLRKEIEDDGNHSIAKRKRLETGLPVIKSVLKDEKGTDYSYKLSWVDKERWLPQRVSQQEGDLQKVLPPMR